MANTRKIPANLDLAERARFYDVCERTVRRWWEQGANLHDVESVANVILRQRNPKRQTLEIIHELIQ